MIGKGQRRAAALATLLALAILALAPAPRAGAFIYWSQGFPIGRANLDGTDALLEWIPLQPNDTCGVAVNSSYLYWSGIGAIGRAKIDGSNPEPYFVPTPNNSCGIAVDGSHIYWNNRTAIGRANLDGSNPEPEFIPNAGGFTAGVAVNGSHIYWGNNGEGYIGRANLDGTGVAPKFIAAPGDPCDVALTPTTLYWSTAPSMWGPSGVFSESLTGGKVTTPKTLINSPAGCGVAANEKYLYWATETPRAIGRANLDGSEADLSFIAGGASAFGLALDSLSAPPFVSLGNLHLNNLLGTARLIVHIGTPGRIRLQGKGVKPAYRHRDSPGTVVLPVIPIGGLKHRLARSGRAKVRLTITFTPLGGTPEPQQRALTLHKRG